MEEKLMMNNILTEVKGLSGLLFHGTIESSTQNVRTTFNKFLNESLNIQDKVYKFMSEKGWYQMEQVEQTQIDKVKQKNSCNCDECNCDDCASSTDEQ